MSSVYKSSTLGSIPLSFTGRHLLQSLREAIQYMVDVDRKHSGWPPSYSPLQWEPVSLARGRLAQYMSQLEKKVAIESFTTEQLQNELALRYKIQREQLRDRGYLVMMGKVVPPAQDNPRAHWNCRSMPVPFYEMVEDQRAGR